MRWGIIFKHFTIDERSPVSKTLSDCQMKLIEEKEKEIQQLKEKLLEKEKLIESWEDENVMLKQENGSLKEINKLLKGNKKK